MTRVSLQELVSDSSQYRGVQVKVTGVLRKSYAVEGNDLIGYELYDSSVEGPRGKVSVVFDGSQSAETLGNYVGNSVEIMGYFIGGDEQSLLITNAVVN